MAFAIGQWLGSAHSHFGFPVSSSGCQCLVCKEVELDAIGRQFELYLSASCVCTAESLWCGPGCCSRTVVVNEMGRRLSTLNGFGTVEIGDRAGIYEHTNRYAVSK